MSVSVSPKENDSDPVQMNSTGQRASPVFLSGLTAAPAEET